MIELTEKKETYVPQNTLDLQLASLDIFMKGLGYIPKFCPNGSEDKYISMDGNNVFNLSTAVRLYNENAWLPFRGTSKIYVAPAFNSEIKLSRWAIECSNACKLIKRVKLGTKKLEKVDKRLVTVKKPEGEVQEEKDVVIKYNVVITHRNEVKFSRDYLSLMLLKKGRN